MAVSGPLRATGAGVSAAPKDNTKPSDEVLEIWRRADAVCFDVDCTCTINDGLDLLAEFMGVGKECEDLTTKAMDGTIDLSKSLEDRLNIINCKPSDVKAFLKAYPPEARLEKGIAPFIKALQARGTKVYLISGGFRELMLPISRYLGVPPENIFANRMLWQWDDETQSPSKLVGFDTSEPTSRNQGKPEAIATIRNKFPYNTVVMIGDGATDLEAVQVTGGADLFIGYGGVVERPAVKAEADWFVTDYSVLEASLKRYKVAMIGYGAWASTAITMVAKNALPESGHSLFEETVQMWVGDEDAEGGKLADVINKTHQNPKYLPGVDLGPNVVANADLPSAVEDADVLIFCAPLQQLRGICTKLVGKLKATTIAVSMIEGMRIPPEGPQLISETVSRFLNVDCSVLMGAHITSGIAAQELSEAVVAYNDRQNAAVLQKLFQRDYFHVELVPDVAGAELCGTLKNIVALAAGMVDGLGFGANTKSAIVRQGMDEMRRLSQELYPAVRDDTFLSSCGIADVMASCLDGPHRAVAMEYTKAVMAGQSTTIQATQQKVLGDAGNLAGIVTAKEVMDILAKKGWEEKFPLFTTVQAIITGELGPSEVTRYAKAMQALPAAMHRDAAKTSKKGPTLAPYDMTMTSDQ